MALSFAFDPSKGETPESIAKQREIANLIAAKTLSRAPQNVGEGLSAIGQALMARGMTQDADAALQAGLKGGRELYSSAYPSSPAVAAPSAVPTTPSVSTPMGSTSIPAGTIDPRLRDAISSVTPSYPDVSPDYLTRLALVENGGKVEGGSPLSSAQGPFQFLKGTASQYGLSNPNDPTASADAAARLTMDNRAALTNALGREPTPGELYLAHQQGAGGAIKLLQNPNSPVESVVGALAARNNAATPGMTAGQFANKWTGKFGDIIQTVDPNQKNIIDAQADMPIAAPTAVAGAAPVPVADDSGAALPPNAQPTGGALPTAQAVQAATQPQTNPRLQQLQQVIGDRYFDFMPKSQQAAVMAEYKQLLEQQQQANDPMRALDMQIKQKSLDTANNKSDWEWKPIGRDANGQWGYGWVNSKTQETKDQFGKPLQANAQPAEDPTAGLNGEDYLKAIPRDRADVARKVANGEIDVASLPNRGNYRMQVLSDAARFDPTFNPIDYKTRLATRKDFTSGKSAQNITSFNTAIGHLDSLDQSIDKLGNRGSSWYNMATAPISLQTDPHYQAALKDFRTSKQAVADELARAFKGAGGTVHDISEWEKTINEADSPVALHAATRRAVELLRSRIDAVGDQYNRGMGKKTDPVQLLSPKARATLERLEGGGASDKPAAPQGKTSSGVSWSIQ